VAGIKKLYAICSGTFWILDNSLQSLNRVRAYEVRIGSERISRGSEQWVQLHDLLDDLDSLLAGQGLKEVIQLSSYPEIARWLSNER
jgi:hypothetical protein